MKKNIPRWANLARAVAITVFFSAILLNDWNQRGHLPHGGFHIATNLLNYDHQVHATTGWYGNHLIRPDSDTLFDTLNDTARAATLRTGFSPK